MATACRILPPSSFSLNPGRRPSLFTSISLPARRSRSFCGQFSGPKISGVFRSSGGIASPGSPKVRRGGCLSYKPEYRCGPINPWSADYVVGDGGSRKSGGGVWGLLIIGSFFNLIVPSAAFASNHHRYMFNLGRYTPLATLFTFGLKAAMVAALGFAAGLVISSVLVWLQNRMDPYLAAALNWGLRMGLSSNFRYQLLKRVAVVLRWLNNVLGKMLTSKDTDLLESESHSKSDTKEYHVNDWGEGASPSGNIRRSQRLVHLKFLVPGGKWVCEVSVLRCFGSGGVIFDISVSPFFGSI